MVDKLDCVAIGSVELNSLMELSMLCVGVGTKYSAVSHSNLAEEEEGERQGEGKEAGG